MFFVIRLLCLSKHQFSLFKPPLVTEIAPFICLLSIYPHKPDAHSIRPIQANSILWALYPKTTIPEPHSSFGQLHASILSPITLCPPLRPTPRLSINLISTHDVHLPGRLPKNNNNSTSLTAQIFSQSADLPREVIMDAGMSNWTHDPLAWWGTRSWMLNRC